MDMISTVNQAAPEFVAVPMEVFTNLLERINHLTAIVEEIRDREATKPEIEPKARYHLEEAAAYLDTSPSTLKRRAALNKLVILYDGKTPFVMGAELLRYARVGARRKPKQNRRMRNREDRGATRIRKP